MRILTDCARSRGLDEATRKTLRLEGALLMEKASLRMWESLRDIIGKRERDGGPDRNTAIVALCGKGDNGGDALAMLRHAWSDGFGKLCAIIPSGEMSSLSSMQAASLRSAGVKVLRWEETDAESLKKIASEADFILDGVLGSGASAPARGIALEMIEWLLSVGGTEGGTKIVAVDLPSGLSDGWKPGDPCARVDFTLALEPAKTVMYSREARLCCGGILPVERVFPVQDMRDSAVAWLMEPADLVDLVPGTGKDAYKMTRGRVAVFAGSAGTVGAARLCARAALASGAGYVTLYADPDIYPIAASGMDSVIVKPSGDPDGRMPDSGAIVAGPGWGSGKGREELLGRLLATGIPCVLDADALRMLASNPGLLPRAGGPVALTPHPGEFAALAAAFGIDRNAGADFRAAGSLAARTGAIIVLKAHVTWIFSPTGETAVWEGLAPELGTAGSGDVLSGLLAGLMARIAGGAADGTQYPDKAMEAAFRASKLAVLSHGMAGKNLAEHSGWFEAGDLAGECARLLHPR